METVIGQDATKGHIINKYNFKVLSSGTNSSSIKNSEEFVPGSQVADMEEKAPSVNPSVEKSGDEISKSSKDELIESLLQKTDEMSSNFIKMQMKLEAKDDEYQASLTQAKAQAFDEGKVEGIKEAGELANNEHIGLMQQFSSSVQTLDSSTKEFSSSIAGIQEELIHAALDIAKEVILVEVGTRGSEIASQLAQELIKEIQTSSQVTLKVNPSDKVSIEQTLGTLENVKIISDNAVSNGGVIVLSDAGNIDGNIMKRYERVKRAALDK